MTVVARRERLAKAFRGLVAAAGTLTLASCAASYDKLVDVRPHPGVASAHALPVHGIDVSRYQKRIDWASVAGAGKRFAYIKATEGGDHVDERFLENWVGSQRAGLARGAYHFMYWCRPAEQQASWFQQVVPQDASALPPVLDLEWHPDSKRCPTRVSKEKALAMARVVLAAMEAHTGKRPIIYTDVNFHRDVLHGELREYPHWIRSTAAEPHERYGDRAWTMWQFTTTGRVPGIAGDVDRNAFYGSEADWARFVQTGCDPRFRCG